MNWLVVVPKDIDPSELKKKLLDLEHGVEVNPDQTPVGDTEYILEVKGSSDLDQKLGPLDIPVKIYPNSGLELY